MSHATEDVEPARTFWRSRRGLRELDLLLIPFTSHRYDTLSAADRLLYQQLLNAEDMDLLAWLQGASCPATFKHIIKQVMTYAKTH